MKDLEEEKDESSRLCALRSLGVLDSHATSGKPAGLSWLVDVCRAVFCVPIALVSLVDEHRQWFFANSGTLANKGVDETDRDVSFCSHAIKNPKQMLVVRDTQKDPRFVDNGLVKGFPFIRFYAGMPLEIEIDGCNWALGTLCVIDVVPREWSKTEEKMLNSLANIATNYLSRYVKSQDKAEPGQKTNQALKTNEKSATITSRPTSGQDLSGLSAVLELLTPSLTRAHRSSSSERDPDIASVPSGLATALALLSSMESSTFRNSNLLAPSNKSTWEVLVLTDADFRILIVNPGWESLTGLKIHETIGNSLFELCCKNNDDGLKNSSESFEFAVRAAVEKGGGPDCCGWISSPKTSAKGVRQKVWFSASATILDGFGSGSVVVIRGYDRTNEKNAAIAMEQAKAVAESSAFAKSRFLANMSHELRTPINAIKLAAEVLMKKNVAQNPEHRELSHMILQSSSHMMELVDQILMYSQQEEGKKTRGIPRSLPTRFDLRECVEQILENFSVQVASKGLELSYVMDDSCHDIIFADSMGVRQVLFNIIGNAVKFTETNGTVDVDIEFLKEKNSNTTLLKFKVADSGPGIHSSKVEKIFLPFEQGDDSMTRKKTGAGLGLSISRNIAERLGGQLTCSMEKERCVFRFEIPVECSPKAKGEKALKRFESIGSVGKEIVGLVVCSSARLRFSVVAILKYLGIQKIIVSESPSVACAELKKGATDVDVILVDEPVVSSTTQEDWFKCAQAIKSWSAKNSESFHQTPLLMLNFLEIFSSEYPIAKKRKKKSDDTTQENVDVNDESRWEALFDEINYQRVTKPVTASRLRVPLEIALGMHGSMLKEHRETEISSSDHEVLETAGLRILLTEDNIINSKVMAKLLRCIGCSNISLAYNGSEAVKAVSSEKFDIVLMDLQMPVMDGIEASRKIFAEPKNCFEGISPPIIAITADVTEEIEARCMDVGIDVFMKKPVGAKELTAVLLEYAKKKKKKKL